ncbi:MAG: hypothetical protein AAF242_17035, partial [Bacteroidota bacterium]
YDAAQFINQNQGQRLRNLGKQALVIGDASYITDDEIPDLLEFCLKKDPTAPSLAYVHQYYPGHLGQLSQAQQISVNGISNYNISVHAVGGNYDEVGKRNAQEQQKVIEILFAMPANAQRTFPRIALVSSSVEQRDAIASQILSIIQEPGESKLKNKLIQMEHSGLQVLALDELQADRFEVLIYSATYTDHLGVIHPHASYWDTSAGKRQLNELMAVGAQQIYLVHSFSNVYVDRASQQSEANGYFLFFNYLSLMSALQSNKKERYNALIQQIQEVIAPSSADRLNSPFYDELTNRLERYLPGIIVTRNEKVAQVLIPVCIRRSEGDRLAIGIIADDVLAQGPDTTLQWETQKRMELSDLGYTILPTWTTSWWKSPNRSVKLLSQQILAIWEETS